jgi:uncharacterized membrane protein
MTLAVGKNDFTTLNSPINPYALFFSGLGFLAWFVNKIFIPFSILVLVLCLLYHNLYSTFFLLSPIDKAWSQVFIYL